MGYDIAVLETLIKNPGSTALYISPLSTNDSHRLDNLIDLAKTADVDIPFHSLYRLDDPTEIVEKSTQGMVLSCDMEKLHSLLLPQHTQWEDFFTNLKFVIIDEIHLYRGIVGSHATNIIRRLKRICRHYNNFPVFLCKTPPFVNTQELAETLLGESVTVVVDKSSPLSEHHTIVYNAALLDSRLNIRRAPVLETAIIAGEALANDIGTVVFAHSQSNVEALASGLSLNLDNRGHKSDQVIPYSGDEDQALLQSI